jgi:hypothetical protein
MNGDARLTAVEVAVLRSIWPRGTYHSGPVADVFTALGRDGRWVLIAKRLDGAYVMVQDSGRRSRMAGSLAALGLPEQPIRKATLAS